MTKQPGAAEATPAVEPSASAQPADGSEGTAARALDPSWRPKYGTEVLPEQMPQAPWPVVEEWLQAAAEQLRHVGGEPGAATLATVDASGMPDARVVLVKDATPMWFRLYSDAGSAKAVQLQGNPQVALLFYWPALHRQLRVRGVVQPVLAQVAAEYFVSRPRSSRLAAAISEQSRPLGSRAELMARMRSIAAQPPAPEAVPSSWRGWDVHSVSVEFWTGDSDRLHDRVLYRSRSGEPVSLADHTQWTWGRLYP